MKKSAIGKDVVEGYVEKLAVFAKIAPDNTILPGFLSLGGFTNEALQLCEAQGIGTADRIAHFCFMISGIQNNR